MQGKFDSMYYKNGRPIYVYTVNCSAKELEQFKAVQGTNYKEHTTSGQPLFWVPGIVNGQRRLLSETINLTITGGDNPRVVFDDTKQQFALMNNIQANLATEIAKEMAKAWVTPAAGGGVSITQPATTTAAAPVKVTEDAAIMELEGAGAARGTEDLDDNKQA